MRKKPDDDRLGVSRQSFVRERVAHIMRIIKNLVMRRNMGEPTGFKAMHADDVGTRLQHMMDLQDQWSIAYGILIRPGFHTELEVSRTGALKIALDLLQHHMETEYNGVTYAVTINNLPKNAEEILDEKPRTTDPTTWRDTV